MVAFAVTISPEAVIKVTYMEGKVTGAQVNIL